MKEDSKKESILLNPEYRWLRLEKGVISYENHAKELFDIAGRVKNPDINIKNKIMYTWNGVGIEKSIRLATECYDEILKELVKYDKPREVIRYNIYDVGSKGYDTLGEKVDNSYFLYLLKKDLLSQIGVDILEYYELKK